MNNVAAFLVKREVLITMAVHRLHCKHCGQTFVGTDISTCSLCRKTGGLVEITNPTDANDLDATATDKHANSNTVAEPRNPNIGNSIKWIAVVVAVLLVVFVAYYLRDQAWRREARTKNDLKSIHLAISSFGDTTRGRSPSKLEDLYPFLHGETWPPEAGKADRDLYQAIKDGKYTVIWDLKDFRGAKEGSPTLVAFETEARSSSGFAIFADFRVERLTAEELEKSISETKTE